MLKNSVYYKSLISFIVLLFVITCLNAESQMTPYQKFDFAYDVLGEVKAEINAKKIIFFMHLRPIFRKKI